jgi:hypothetical protein
MKMASHYERKYGNCPNYRLTLRPLSRLEHSIESHNKLHLGIHRFGVGELKIGIDIASTIVNLNGQAFYF